MAARIDILSLSLRYSDTALPALDSVSLEIPQGGCVGIVGPTGSGKSTLLDALSGILGKHHPEVVVSGQLCIGSDTFQGIPREVLFPTVGLVLQDPFIQISGVRDTVTEELRFTLENLDAAGQGSDQLIQTMLSSLGIEHLADRAPTTLSGGETQRVALASILISNPSVLLLDEPVTALDATAQNRLRSILKSLRGRTTVLLTDSQIDFPMSVCDTIVVLDRGRIEACAKPAELLLTGKLPTNVGGSEHWSSLVTPLNQPSSRGPGPLNRIRKALGLP